MTWPRALLLVGVLFIVAIGVIAAVGPLRAAGGIRNRVLGRSSIEYCVREYAPIAEPRLRTKFQQAGVAYPPDHIPILALKEERQLRVYARANGG